MRSLLLGVLIGASVIGFGFHMEIQRLHKLVVSQNKDIEFYKRIIETCDIIIRIDKQ